MSEIQQVEIAVSDAVLNDLRERLKHARFPEPIPDTDWDYGTEAEYLKELCAYWRDKYDWRAWERLLNRFDHFETAIEGVDLHFIHAPSPHPEALPLIVTHGWPGSVFEFYKIIDPLRDPTAHGGDAADAFHVI